MRARSKTEAVQLLLRHLANLLTAARIPLSAALLFCAPLSPAFHCLYALCGVTDALDGFVARKTHTANRFGAALDSIADFVFLSAALYRLCPVILRRLPVWSVCAAAVIGGLRLVSYGVGMHKYRRFPALHTRLNKLAGAMLYFVPYLLYVCDIRILCCALCLVSGAAALEELLITLRSPAFVPDVKSILER